MRDALLEYLACPACSSELAIDVERREDEHVMAGRLRCEGCSTDYPIRAGVPRLNAEMTGLERVAETFAFEWKIHHQGGFERETLFGRTSEEDWRFFLDCTGKSEDEIVGAIVLDAGCGSGRFARLVGEHDAEASIGVDINEAVVEAFESCRDLPNVHIVQGNIQALPLKPRIFDLIWCAGVLHHTPDPAGGHAALTRHVRRGGSLYVWVYAKRFNPFRFIKSALDAVWITRFPEPVLLGLAKALSYPSLALLWVYRAVRAVPPLRPRSAWGRRTVRPRSLRALQLTWFDALAPEYDSRHREAEVIGWFERAGFEHVTAIEEPKVGVRGVAPRSR